MTGGRPTSGTMGGARRGLRTNPAATAAPAYNETIEPQHAVATTGSQRHPPEKVRRRLTKNQIT